MSSIGSYTCSTTITAAAGGGGEDAGLSFASQNGPLGISELPYQKRALRFSGQTATLVRNQSWNIFFKANLLRTKGLTSVCEITYEWDKRDDLCYTEPRLKCCFLNVVSPPVYII